MKRVSNGEFTCCLRDDGKCTSPDEPDGTRSLTVGYLDRDQRRIFVVHLYLRPNGDVGASGEQDPKWLFEAETGVLYQSVRE